MSQSFPTSMCIILNRPNRINISYYCYTLQLKGFYFYCLQNTHTFIPLQHQLSKLSNDQKETWENWFSDNVVLLLLEIVLQRQVRWSLSLNSVHKTHTRTHWVKSAFTKEIFYNNGEYVSLYFKDSYICLLLNFTSLHNILKRWYFDKKFSGFFPLLAPYLFYLNFFIIIIIIIISWNGLSIFIKHYHTW